MRINWPNPIQRLECAKFLLDRIILLYIYELFPEAVSNGIDVYNGCETVFDNNERNDKPLLETAEPETIAKLFFFNIFKLYIFLTLRYWLIRFFVRIAEPSNLVSKDLQSTSDQSNNNNVSSYGLPIFKQVFLIIF
jgi:hypothetical protein